MPNLLPFPVYDTHLIINTDLICKWEPIYELQNNVCVSCRMRRSAMVISDGDRSIFNREIDWCQNE